MVWKVVLLFVGIAERREVGSKRICRCWEVKVGVVMGGGIGKVEGAGWERAITSTKI